MNFFKRTTHIKAAFLGLLSLLLSSVAIAGSHPNLVITIDDVKLMRQAIKGDFLSLNTDLKNYQISSQRTVYE